ncbi:MAG: hypothetical protein V3U67_09845 [Gemmatimonadota bacterium]
MIRLSSGHYSASIYVCQGTGAPATAVTTVLQLHFHTGVGFSRFHGTRESYEVERGCDFTYSPVSLADVFRVERHDLLEDAHVVATWLEITERSGNKHCGFLGCVHILAMNGR